ncbi:MAG TPA: hypothetical protein VFZ85_17175 [Jiangellaceae bacterium]
MTGLYGDDALAERMRALLGKKHQVVAAATVTPGEVRVASIGAADGADFEIGSISKGVTGLLYADTLAREEITPTTKLGDVLPLDGVPAAGLTLPTSSPSSAPARDSRRASWSNETTNSPTTMTRNQEETPTPRDTPIPRS